jgi:hypothetical protein
MTLIRTETAKGHKYTLDGKPVTGVTTLIGGGLPKPALVGWGIRSVAEYAADHLDQLVQMQPMGRNALVAALKQSPYSERDKAANRGTEVHTLAEKLVRGEEVEVPDALAGHVESYVRFLDDWQPDPVLVEFAGANRKWWYAGTGDLVAWIGGDLWLLDVKTAKGVYGDNALQVDAYRNFEFYLGADGAEHPMPEGITRLGVIHVRADSYDLVPLDSTGEPFRDFTHAAWIAKREKNIRGYVGIPLPHPTRTEGAA